MCPLVKASQLPLLPLDPAPSSCQDFGFLPNWSPCFLPWPFSSLFFMKKHCDPFKKIGQMCPNFTGSKSLNVSWKPFWFGSQLLFWKFLLKLLSPLPAVLPQVTLQLQLQVTLAGLVAHSCPPSAHREGQLPVHDALLPPVPKVPVWGKSWAVSSMFIGASAMLSPNCPGADSCSSTPSTACSFLVHLPTAPLGWMELPPK